MKRRDFVKLGATTFACGNITASYADDFDSGRCGPEDLAWTIYDHLNMNKTARYTATDGRPHNLVKEDSKNILKDIS